MDKGTDLGEMIARFMNVNNIARNLYTDSNPQFMRFFEKLFAIDRRALYFYVKANQEKFSPKQVKFAKDYFEQRGIRWER
ncbi:MAG: hypothetical protein FWG83_03835 [Oscillospiraceae bacterium]|nr:hypothetical protein [Oscillospiraceae bacterium]